MKLGFVSAILPELTLEEVLALCQRERFRTVELMCWPKGRAERRFAGVTHVDLAGLTRSRASEITGMAAAHDVEISSLGYYPNPLDADPEVAAAAVAHLKKVIRAAPLLGLNTVTTFTGRDHRLTIDDNWPRFLKTWKPLLKLAADHGVRIAIENCPMKFGDAEWPGGKNLFVSPAVWRRAFQDLPSENLGLNFDPSHFILQFMDPVSPLMEFREKLFHIHAKDLTPVPALLNEHGAFAHPKLWHKQRIPGFGSVDWQAFFRTLREAGYDGPVCIEVEDDTFGQSLEGRTSALLTARNYLEPWFV